MNDAHKQAFQEEARELLGELESALLELDQKRDDSETVLRKIRSADGSPGVVDSMFDEPVRLYDAYPAYGLRGEPGSIVAQSDGALARATVDGAVALRANAAHANPRIVGAHP